MRSVVTACFLVAAAASCDRPPSTDLREWVASDHDRAEEKSRLKSGEQVRGGGSDDTTLIEMTWQSQCARCHGPLGRGDGPDGPMVKAQDLTSEELQSQRSDADLARVIRDGKGQMPKFDKIPPKVVEGLVARIRATRGFKGNLPQ